jgi:hypothetical protein
MGAGHHPLPVQAHTGRKDLVVRKRGGMNKGNKKVQGIDWTAIFERRPDLQPPGYYETIAKLYKKEDTDVESK